MAGRKKVFLFAALLIWLAAVVAVLYLLASSPVSAGQTVRPVYSVAREDKRIALTFDAAWDDSTTDGVLAVLNDRQVKATFFFVGSYARRYPTDVVKIHNAGHEVANHSMTHLDPVTADDETLYREISECSDVLFSLTGVAPALYRAPSGSWDARTVLAAKDLGLTAVQWSVDPVDWKDPPPETVVRRVLAKAAPGGIILLHLGKENTLEALPALIDALKAEGYTFVTVSSLLLDGDTYVDPDGVQRPVTSGEK
ncbi:MAG: polysaccharide deacetylase family protein [Clostridia bacterium]|nr:polysaccharide deacetylase family protein [Clostridia bacterium]